MDQVALPSDPWSALVAAIERRDLGASTAALSDTAVLVIPPLHLTLTGRDEILDGVARVLEAFPDLGYRARGRYVAPGTITDEASAAGTHSGPFLGSPPTGRRATLPLRVIAEHDDRAVTMITMYPDVASLRTLGGATARHIDLTATNVDASSPLVSALRASMQPSGNRLFIGRARDASATPSRPVAAAVPLQATGPPSTAGSRGSKGPKLKAPVPRRVRRTRAVVGGLVMLTAAAVIITWVATTVLRQDGGRVSAAQRSRPSTALLSLSRSVAPTAKPPVAVSRPPVRSAPTDSPSPSTYHISATDEVTLSTDLLFDSGSTIVSSTAHVTLASIVNAIVAKGITGGIITVTGYTDDVGPRGDTQDESISFNQILSVKRARAVADVLSSDLLALGLHFDVEAVGRGVNDPVATNDTRTGRSQNRRVTIQAPQPK